MKLLHCIFYAHQKKIEFAVKLITATIAIVYWLIFCAGILIRTGWAGVTIVLLPLMITTSCLKIFERISWTTFIVMLIPAVILLALTAYTFPVSYLTFSVD
jgi:hypothetical protein